MTFSGGSGAGRPILLAAGGAVLFAALAVLFVQLLRPIAASGGDRAEQQTEEKQPVMRAGDMARHPIGKVPSALVDPPAEKDAAKAEPAAPAPDFAPLPEGPVVAIVMTELGPNAPASRRAIEALPAAVTFTFSPYADISRSLAADAKAGGHEVFASLPMEPSGYPSINPGENTLLRRNDGAENVRRLEWTLGRVGKIDGVTGMMGSAFTRDTEALRPVLAEIGDRGLVYIDARASARSVAEQVAKEAGLHARSNDRFLDEPATPANISGNLDALLATAKRRGSAIGYARPTDNTIDALADFQARAEAEGVTFVGAARLAAGRPE